MKRLRLRGDWSDTGPRARPESERERDGKIRAVTGFLLDEFKAEVSNYRSGLPTPRHVKHLLLNPPHKLIFWPFLFYYKNLKPVNLHKQK